MNTKGRLIYKTKGYQKGTCAGRPVQVLPAGITYTPLSEMTSCSLTYLQTRQCWLEDCSLLTCAQGFDIHLYRDDIRLLFLKKNLSNTLLHVLCKCPEGITYFLLGEMTSGSLIYLQQRQCWLERCSKCFRLFKTLLHWNDSMFPVWPSKTSDQPRTPQQLELLQSAEPALCWENQGCLLNAAQAVTRGDAGRPLTSAQGFHITVQRDDIRLLFLKKNLSDPLLDILRKLPLL